jgi:hypothetical protein
VTALRAVTAVRKARRLRAPPSGLRRMQAPAPVDRAHLERELVDLAREMKVHSLGMTIASAAVAAAFALFGLGPTAVAAASALVAYAVLSKQKRSHQ